MRYLGPYVRYPDQRRFMVIVRDDGSKSTISYARYLMLGKVKDEEVVDHVDEDKTNDDPANLQILSRAENAIKTNNYLTQKHYAKKRALVAQPAEAKVLKTLKV